MMIQFRLLVSVVAVSCISAAYCSIANSTDEISVTNDQEAILTQWCMTARSKVRAMQSLRSLRSLTAQYFTDSCNEDFNEEGSILKEAAMVDPRTIAENMDQLEDHAEMIDSRYNIEIAMPQFCSKNKDIYYDIYRDFYRARLKVCANNKCNEATRNFIMSRHIANINCRVANKLSQLFDYCGAHNMHY